MGHLYNYSHFLNISRIMCLLGKVTIDKMYFYKIHIVHIIENICGKPWFYYYVIMLFMKVVVLAK